MSLLGDPDFLILDEPTNGLDPDGIIWIRDYLKKLADDGKTIIVSSHLLNEAQKFIDCVVIIKEGSVAYEGDVSDLKEACSKYSGRENLDLEELMQFLEVGFWEDLWGFPSVSNDCSRGYGFGGYLNCSSGVGSIQEERVLSTRGLGA
ncbi:Daunorubicin/doxorubicin resistance ATP-binding protein DrrA [Dermatophilus congolensis]|uniref:Daunorubicin/doxorubicin resistance ATP-binding protein DrrA n=2 Tax=Dermatophilus congolensis TaxID=1863 RepID=A0AA46GZY0_9MICO|nr:Daunorubicin/doxorubicin resistance ATP-binding protein DrrA [Dermatophilus congolensis]